MIKKFITGLLCITVAAAGLTGCSDKEKPQSDVLGTAPYRNFDVPESGEDIVVLNVEGYGEIKIKLFEDLSQKGCENFKTHAANKYYDGLIFHRVMENFMIQGGDPDGKGTGGESIWGGKFDGGVSPYLYHFTGAVAYANSGADYGYTASNGSQFYIVVESDVTDSYLDYIEQQNGIKYSDEVREKYKEVGGAPYLDGNYTVFGQVIEGLDVAIAISKAPTRKNSKGEKSIPTPAIVLTSAEVVQY